MSAYRAYFSTLINFSEKTQKTRLLCKVWTKDTAGHMGVTDVAGCNQGLRTRATQFATSSGRAHGPFPFKRVSTRSAYSTRGRCLPETNSFRQQFCFQIGCSSERAAAKLQISDPVRLADHLHKAAQQRRRKSTQRTPRKQVMRLPYTRVQIKHLSIPQNQTSYNIDNVFTNSLPDLVVIGLLDDADFAGGYQHNPFTFQYFGINRIELRRNEMLISR